MTNYISINNQKIELTEDQVEKIRATFDISTTRLADVPVGEVVKIGDHEMIVLEQSGDTTALIRKDFISTGAFGRNNNYDGSSVDEICNKFAEEITAIVGEKNIVLHTVDLTSDDGLKDYGKIKRRASLLTTAMYRRYVEILDKFNPKKWWWLATAFSTKKHNDTSCVKCVSPFGFIIYFGCGSDGGGVRPFCILKSTIFVSK